MDLSLSGLKLIERQQLGDDRGFLARLFCSDELAIAGWTRPIAQVNHTCTAIRGTVRGLHFQRPPHCEMKLVSCLRGEIWDVAVDIRTGSDTFLKWHAERITADNRRAFLIPEGFAHGYQTLTDDVELLYCHSSAYSAESEAGLNVQDPKFAIPWPLQIAWLSTRDSNHAFVSEDFMGIAH